MWKVETYKDNYDTLQDQFVHVGSDISRVADSIVSSIDSSIDANDLENQRKINAGFKKLLQDLRSNRASDPRAVAHRSAEPRLLLSPFIFLRVQAESVEANPASLNWTVMDRTPALISTAQFTAQAFPPSAGKLGIGNCVAQALLRFPIVRIQLQGPAELC